MRSIEWFFEYPLVRVSKDVYAFPKWGLYDGQQIVFPSAAPMGRQRRRRGDGELPRVARAPRGTMTR